MKFRYSHPAHPAGAVILGCLLALASQPGLAGKPDWAEDGKPGKAQKHQKSKSDDGRAPMARSTAASGVSVQVQIGGYFGEPQRVVVRDYYGPRLKAGKCPPGLAKKGNGCQPPGQAKAWRRGGVLPADVVYYPVPASVQVRLGVPPVGHKFVRVASDILLIAIGTSMVIDAIEDLGRL